MKKLYIPDSVKNIGDEAFFGCDSLEDVTIPKKFADRLVTIFGRQINY